MLVYMYTPIRSENKGKGMPKMHLQAGELVAALKRQLGEELQEAAHVSILRTSIRAHVACVRFVCLAAMRRSCNHACTVKSHLRMLSLVYPCAFFHSCCSSQTHEHMDRRTDGQGIKERNGALNVRLYMHPGVRLHECTQNKMRALGGGLTNTSRSRGRMACWHSRQVSTCT
jgi:hypothetical protein